MSTRGLITGALVAIAVVGVAAMLFQMKKGAPETERLPEPYQRFMACLPSDITEDEKAEIHGILYRYHATAREGQVEPDDQIEMGRELNAFVTQGAIDRDELYHFMARVSYYTHRTDPNYYLEDRSGVHPLLEEEAADSTRE